MTSAQRQHDELYGLIDSLCDEQLDEAGQDRLAALVADSDEAMWIYVAEMNRHAALAWDWGRTEKGHRNAECKMLNDEWPRLPMGEGGDGSLIQHSAFSIQHSSSPAPIPPIIIQTIPAPLSSFSSFIGSALFSYSLAAVIVGLGLLVAAAWKLPGYSEIARDETTVGRQQVIPSSLQTVGRVTGLVDCQWSDPSTEAFAGAYVHIGRRYAIRSGVLEITYSSGAKVILQGPVTYEVESPRSGFLSVGKLTAKLEKKVVSGQWPVARESETSSLSTIHYPLSTAPSPKPLVPSPSSNPQSLIPNPSFAVRTPTAVVTDLGTEFGVAVSKDGHTISHVFRGSVKLEPIATKGGSPAAARILYANESAQVTKTGDDGRLIVQPIATDPTTFVRPADLPKLADDSRLKAFRRWQTYSQELRRDPSLVAYYDFQQLEGKPAVLPNVAANGDRTLDGTVENAAWVVGRMPGKHALRFGGEGDCVRLDLPMKFDDLTLAASAYVEGFEDHLGDALGYGGLLMSDGWSDRPGKVHWHVRSDGRVIFGVSQGCYLPDLTRAFGVTQRCQWRHIAFTYNHDAARARFFVDGQMTDEAAVERHVPICFGRASIGVWKGAQTRCLHGRIDELAVFARPLKSEEILRMFNAGNPTWVTNTKN